ncbi:uncharacterized protein NDAI_0A05090 [Naumovozyma dairenensis CBS 421]|uniref:Uncharacterized protein n=1 Tax=Naumovozyma dairenensis (strain ATCC 10597 / BCRC 20456 / CBS 421 / NBRC 0211 / NRRL Y-12639) TaxID=1071378 RepID=G0W4C6_NAUDC|nr:hypothetical protein NDAI_0A05090 [Naumovozyma dairenensis CBS 421]CCD22664.1 hypothetical protein NDAI_0A05090 [Naumovozyma dairenensis CBS 421]
MCPLPAHCLASSQVPSVRVRVCVPSSIRDEMHCAEDKYVQKSLAQDTVYSDDQAKAPPELLGKPPPVASLSVLCTRPKESSYIKYVRLISNNVMYVMVHPPSVTAAHFRRPFPGGDLTQPVLQDYPQAKQARNQIRKQTSNFSFPFPFPFPFFFFPFFAPETSVLDFPFVSVSLCHP